MHFMYDMLPVILFFVTFKWFGIYAATVVGMVATLAQVLITRMWRKKWDKTQLITFGVFLVFGSMTLYFHNPIFVKWKPTIVFWIFALCIVSSQLLTAKSLIQRLMEKVLEDKAHIPPRVWKQLTWIWVLFFLVMGGVNLYIAYQYSNNAWVNFKFYGITSALFLVSILQSLYLMRYLPEDKNSP